MRHIQNGYRGLSVFVDLNVDRFLSIGAVALALTVAVWIQSL